MEVPQAISNLRLRMAFRGHAVDVLDCVETKADPAVYVVDDEDLKISRFADADVLAAGCFVGMNPAERDLHLFAIDNKFIKSPEGGVADCALFHADLFALIEFKSNAEGRTIESVVYTYEKAISQLEHTLEMFKAKLTAIGIDLLRATEIVCHVVVAPIFPRRNAMEMNYSLAFAMRNGVELSFESQREF